MPDTPDAGRRLAANRANARSSTGPRTDAGKRRSARNAQKHGLSVPASLLPAMAAEIEACAARLASPGASGDAREAAREAAAARLDLARVRATRATILAAIEKLLDEPEPGEGDQWTARLMAGLIEDGDGTFGKVMPAAEKRQGRELVARLLQTDTPRRIGRLLEEAARLERYDRRAFSRMRGAMARLAAMRNDDEAKSLAG